MPCRHAGDGNTGSLDRQNFIDSVFFKNAVELGTNLVQKFYIQLMVQKTIYFQYITGTDLSLLQNTLFKKFHLRISPFHGSLFFGVSIMANSDMFCKFFTINSGIFLSRWQFDNIL